MFTSYLGDEYSLIGVTNFPPTPLSFTFSYLSGDLHIKGRLTDNEAIGSRATRPSAFWQNLACLILWREQQLYSLTALQHLFQPGWPDWANFRQIDYCLLWTVFLKITKVVGYLCNFGLLFPQLRLCINFDKKGAGLHFGRFFNKLVWSPWFQLVWRAQLIHLGTIKMCATILVPIKYCSLFKNM
jgi:hypothetical protein